MSVGSVDTASGADQPLTRADVEALLAQVSSPSELNLRLRNLIEIDLSGMDLDGATLVGAKLTRAKLKGAKLKGARLDGAILHQVDRRVALQCVRRVAVTQPVGRHLALDAGALCSFPDDALDCRGV